MKDKLCQRAIEKIKMNLTKDPNVGKDHSERTQETDITLSESTIQKEEGNSEKV